MLENFRGLRIKGRCFENETTLNFFSNSGKFKNNRVSLVFGRNGSGKSTVSKIFSAIKSKTPLEGMSFIEAKSYDNTPPGKEVNLSDLSSRVAIFNEDYIRSKIFIDGDRTGLGAIVLFGKQKEIDEEIRKIEASVEILQDEHTALLTEQKRLNDPNDTICPENILQRILTTLQNQKTRSGWAYRNLEIYNKKKAPTPDETLIKEIIALRVKDSDSDTLDNYSKQLNHLKELDSYAPDFIVPKVELDSSLDFDEEGLISLLNHRVEKPELTLRDQRIIEVLKTFGVNWVNEVTTHLKRDNVSYCPCCLRDLDIDDKELVCKSVSAALSEDVNKYRHALSSFIIPSIPSFDLSAYDRIAPEESRRVKWCLRRLSKELDRYRAAVKERLDSIYSEPKFVKNRFAISKRILKRHIDDLENRRIKFELQKKGLNAYRDELEALNRRIAKKEIEKDNTYYHLAISQREEIQGTIKRLSERISFERKNIQELEAQKASIEIAADRINSALAYIFFSKERLQLAPDNGVYKIISNGHDVKPQDISIGERNALALAYFFSEIMDGSEVKKAYENERLIILDDPVSSFDHENKMGVLSYIMFEIENLTCTITDKDGNKLRPETRLICLMHELYSYIALAQCIKSHDDNRNDPLYKIGQMLLTLDFKWPEMKASDEGVERINEYCRNFEEIFEFAATDPSQLKENIHVGNQARRMLEAFSTFVFRKGIEFLFLNDLISGENAVQYNQYYRTIFSRFVVHDESHLQGRIRSLTNHNGLLPFIDNSTRQLAVQDSICLLYLIMPSHVLSLCKPGDRDNIKKTIEKWLTRIRATTPTTGVSDE